MPDALSNVAARARRTPQSLPVPGREQIPNSAGGFTFKVSDATRLNRFLTLGTEKGTYYTSESALTKANADFIIEMAKADAAALTAAIVNVSEAGRAPRNNPALFALAIAASYGDEDGKRTALAALPRVARTGTHLFTFIGYVNQFRGWGPALHRAITNWYANPAVSQVEYQTVKYQQREGWTHRDVLRKIKPRATGTRNQLFRYLTDHADADLSELPLVRAYKAAQAATTPKAWISIIEDNPSISWEMLPDAARTHPEVWAALVKGGLPQTALLRQLPTLTRLGLLDPMSELTPLVTSQLTDAERLRKGRVHPINILVAMKTYEQGRNIRGGHTWTPSTPIIDALDAAFYNAYGAIEPANKRTMLALDVSGSMSASAGGLPVSCCEVTAALALTVANTEPANLIVGFTASSAGRRTWRGGTELSTLNISPRQRLTDATRETQKHNFGGTDCALPMVYATQNNLAIDTFVVLTDNETWAGDIHPFQALQDYRKHSGIEAKLVVVALTPVEFSIADPNDAGMLDVSGFDSNVPTLITDFSAGRI